MGILTDVHEELYSELPRFFENYEEDLGKLKQNLDDRDAEAIESTVHRIKGSSGSWGFHAIQEAAIELEEAAKDRNWDAIESRMSTLEDHIVDARETVTDELKES